MRRATQADVAQLAGASKAVVSAVINDRHDGIRCSAATRERIWAAVRELGYVPNPVARRLAHGRSHLLGVFTYQPVFPVGEGDFYRPFLIGVEEEAERQGFDLLLFTRRHGARRTIYHDGANSLQLADGAVLFGAEEDKAELAKLISQEFPFVYIGRRDVAGLSYVAADYLSATREVVSAMRARGHQRIAYLCSRGNREVAADREAGYRAAYGGELDERLIVRVEDFATEFQALWNGGIRAFVTEGWFIGSAVLDHARGRSFRIPDDLSLAVLDDNAPPDAPDVTGFTIPKREMGAGAVRILMDVFANPAEPRRIVLPCRFAAGTTVSAV
ncbi:MAG TPA: LacI family DNA-binding transcriptional regulator [Mycobacteriales bacterium]|nr:LacI family DNA-binding transcriptional regulator [Mycobacteriales bacterium]